MMMAVPGGGASDFHDVFVEHHRRLLRIAYLLTGSLPQAEDHVAEAFARTWVPWERGDVRDVGAYLTRAVVNRVHGEFRHRRVVDRTPRRPERVIDDAGQQTGDRDVLRRAVATLPRGQRIAVVLRFVGDLSEESTAEVMGVSVGTVKSQVARALASLRAALRDEEMSQ
jgi:RNA polymerase sigma-70 factor (sigma-E family)